MKKPTIEDLVGLAGSIRYQPIFDVATRRPVGIQVLLESFTPSGERSETPPSGDTWHKEFDHVEVDRCVFRAASINHEVWRDAGASLWLSVPISPLMLEATGLLSGFNQIAAEHQLQPGTIEFGILSDFPLRLEQPLPHLHKASLRLCALSFGTGHSSLSSLGKLPFTRIEISRLHISDLSDTGSVQLIKSMAALGKSLKVDVTAAGVDSEEVADQVTAAGFTQMRGSFLAPTMNAAEMRAWVSRLPSC